jgi:dipeptidyl aminopeptidase/acylaminoacyl peptidase
MHHVCLLSLQDPDAGFRRVNTSGDFALDPVWSPDSDLLAWHEWDSPCMPWHESRIMVARLSDARAPVEAVSGGGAVAQPRFSPDGHRLGFLSDREGWLTLWEVNVDAGPNIVSGPPRRLASLQAEHAPPTWGPGLRTWAWTGTAEVVVWRNQNGCGALERWADGALSAVLRADTVAEGVTARENEVVAILGSPSASPRIEMIRPTESITVARSAPVAMDRAGPVPKTVAWSSDGWMINARLYQPSGCAKAPSPLLVWLHQGPTGQALAVLDPRIAYFVERGWAVLVPDHRGSTGWGRAFTLSLDGAWGVADAADVIAGVTLACQEGWADPDNIALYGGSAGGFLALRLLAMRPDLFAGGATLFPVSHLLDTVTPPWRYQANYIDRLLGGRPPNRSPLHQAGHLKQPVLILHGSEDYIVPPWHSEALANAVNAAGGIAEFHIYKGEGHGWVGGQTLADELRRVEAFLRRHVLSRSRT